MSKVKYKKPKRTRFGKRVYKTKKNTVSSSSKKGNRKKKYKTAFGVIGLCVLVVVGYLIASPIHKALTENKNEENEETESITVESVTEASSGESVEITEENTVETEVGTNTDTTLTLSEIKAKEVSFAALADIDTLTAELTNIKNEGYNACVFNLKDKGGKIYFNIKSPFASFVVGDYEYIMSELYADEIAEVAKDAGLVSIAEINLLEDYNIYGESGYGSYKSDDGTIWTDSNGNSYLSPLDENTVDYVADIAGEISSGGFDYIMITGDKYPEFTSSDYDILGEGLAFGDRNTYLARVANAVYEKAEENNCNVIYKTTAGDIDARNDEVLNSDELKIEMLAVVYSDDVPVLTEYNGMNVIPVYETNAPEDSENYILMITQNESTDTTENTDNTNS